MGNLRGIGGLKGGRGPRRCQIVKKKKTEKKSQKFGKNKKNE